MSTVHVIPVGDLGWLLAARTLTDDDHTTWPGPGAILEQAVLAACARLPYCHAPGGPQIEHLGPSGAEPDLPGGGIR